MEAQHETEIDKVQKLNQKLLQDIKKKPIPTPKVPKKRVRDMSVEFPRNSRSKGIIVGKEAAS